MNTLFFKYKLETVMPPANKYMDVSSVLESVDRPSLKNLTTSEYGKPNKAYNELLESLGKFTLI